MGIMKNEADYTDYRSDMHLVTQSTIIATTPQAVLSNALEDGVYNCRIRLMLSEEGRAVAYNYKIRFRKESR